MSESPTKSEADPSTPRYQHGDDNRLRTNRTALERVLYVTLIAAVLTLGRYTADWHALNDSYLNFLKGPLKSGGIPGLGYLLTALILLGAISPSRLILPAVGFAASLLWIPVAAALGGLSIT
ncbi:MAG: hypothetical protein ACJA0P_000754 [Planctomycetota bacterium]